MFKCLCAKAIVPVTIAVTGFVVVCCLMLYSAIKADMTEEAVRHTGDLVDTIVKSTSYTMLKSDRETLSNIIDNVGTQQGVVHVRLYSPEGLTMYSESNPGKDIAVDRKESTCDETAPTATLGKERQTRQYINDNCNKVLAVSTPIINNPRCSTADCHFHPADEKILGFLDVGISQEPLEKTLSVLGSRMIVFSIMVLLLTVGGVSALLRRNVFTPIQLLLEYTEKNEQENLEDHFPEVCGELELLARNFGQIVVQRDTARRQLEYSREQVGTRTERQTTPDTHDERWSSPV